jgi:transcriptional regulator with XRE-family HTH domain
MTLDEIQKALQHRNLKKVAEYTGISYNTVWRIASDNAKKPSFEDVLKIKDYLEQN